MFATVRNRRGVITEVVPFDGEDGRLHLVHLDYKDDQLPLQEKLLWEIEARKKVLEPTSLPRVDATGPMAPDDFDALVRASRWSAAMPFLDPDGDGPLGSLPISSPFHGALQVEDFQLVPLLKALRMPRVNLLLADDVGLGKTIEAGLILKELLLRRRIQRVLILTPASLRVQWQDEMDDKFALDFELVDRQRTQNLKKRLGMDANPWRAHSRIIASYYYLRQPDVLEQFRAACQTPEGSPRLPWDLLIVDECHNLMPSPFGEDSDLCNMLRTIAAEFEHRIFLSATPHNGHTRSFTGLLEILDPVRFSQTDELRPAERDRIQQIVIRRLKRAVNRRTDPPRFCHRNPPHAIELPLSDKEIDLSRAFDAFRKEVRRLIFSGQGQKRRAGTFAVEILGKRLLSCPTAFAESWRRCREGLAELRAAEEAEVDAVRRDLESDTGDDRETQSREATAAGVVGAWLKGIAGEVQPEIDGIDRAVEALGLAEGDDDLTERIPKADARFDALVKLINERLREGGSWRDDERLVVFTEYKTTLDYLRYRLRERYDEERILSLFGGMDDHERDGIKQAFNDPKDDVRVLLATDAAAEGLNLQRTARYLLHFDIPWNPSRLEQRNGRLDRHGQARDVTVFYYVSDRDQDVRFLAHVLRKANDIREDLGSANELFDEAAHRRLLEGEDERRVAGDLDLRIEKSRGRARVDADEAVETTEYGQAANDQLAALADELDLSPTSLRDTLEAAMAIHAGRPQIDCGEDATCRILNPSLPGWSEIVDESLRRRTRIGAIGAVARVAFTPEPFMEQVGPRQVFQPRSDVLLMHLSHPMIERATAMLTRRRFPGTADQVSRWVVRRGGVPDGADALILLTLEELAVNELRETFHHWIRTVALPVRTEALGSPLEHLPASRRNGRANRVDEDARRAARDLFFEVEPDLRRFVARHTDELTGRLRNALDTAGEQARREEEQRYQSRRGEVSALIESSTLQKLEREIERMRAAREQGLLFDQAAHFAKLEQSIDEKEREISRRREHYNEVRDQLERERERILKNLLPKRYAMSGAAQVFPIAIEIRLPIERL